MRKLYYSISEVCQLVDEEQHILRYWEKEFPQLKPKKNRGGNRIYSQRDLHLIGSIKKLLREDKLNLKTAKEKLSDMAFKPFDEVLFVDSLIQSKNIGPRQKQIEKEQDMLGKEFSLSQQDADELLKILRRFSKILNQNKA